MRQTIPMRRSDMALLSRWMAIPTLVALVALSGCPAKDVQAGLTLIECIDENLDLPVDQIIAKCGPDAAPLIEQRKALARKRNPCTTITPDASTPNGPGR